MNFKTFSVDKKFLTLQITGYRNKEKIIHEYTIVGWCTTDADPSEGRFSTVNRQVYPVLLTEKAFPVSIYELSDQLMHENVQNITYTYLVDGKTAFSKYQKSDIKPEANKPLQRRV